MVRAPSDNTPSARLARVGLRLAGGWSYVGPVPTVRHAVCLAVPHTSNMDGVLLVLLAASIGLPISWMVKDDWGKGPVGAIIRQLGGVPIDRSAPHGMVGQMIDEMKRREELYLVIPPEGTRKRTEYWKSGFYRIAVGADVPVVPGFLDYASKTGGFGDPIYMTGDVAADMDKIRAVYTAVAATPRYPDKFGPIRLREESEAIPGAHLK